MRRLSGRISAVFPNAFKKPELVTDPNSPLIYSGSLLQMSDVHMLPVQQKEITKKSEGGIKLYGAFGGYAVIRSLLEYPPSEFYKLLWTPTRDFLVWIGSVRPGDTLEALFSTFKDTAYGVARLSGRQIQTLITFKDVIERVKTGGLTTKLHLDGISSGLLAISEEASLEDALHLMLKARVRRLFLENEEGRFISDRSILALLFSPYMLKVARETPARWLDLRVNQLPKGEATLVSDYLSVQEGAKRLGPLPDDCLLTEGGRVVTRWDIVIKTWEKDLELVLEPAVAGPVRGASTTYARSKRD